MVTSELNQLPFVEPLLQHSRERHVTRGEFVFHQGTPARNLYMLISGSIRLTQITGKGQVVAMKVFAPGSLFGMLAVLGEGTFPGSTQAVKDSVVLEIPGSAFRNLIHEKAEVGEYVIAQLVTQLHAAHDRIREQCSEAVEQRIARCILRLCDRFGQQNGVGLLIDIPLTRQDIAELVGTRLETVSRTIRRWEQADIVVCKREQVCLRNQDALAAIANATSNGN